MAKVTNFKLNIIVGVLCMPISMAVLAFTFSVANRLFVSDELLSGWHAAWSNPLMLAAVSAVVTFVRLTSNALEEWDLRNQRPHSGRSNAEATIRRLRAMEVRSLRDTDVV
jgi:hypothetical protein